MATYTFDGTSQTTPTFNPATDIVVLNVTPAQIRDFTQSGSNVTITTATGTLTLTGVSLAALAQSNFALGGGIVQIGDNTNATLDDQFANTRTGGTGNDILLGLGGDDIINAGNGNNLIFGGSGVTDANDGIDNITSGTGNDTIYGNAGNDIINSGGGSDIIYGGLGGDQINAGAILGGQATSIFGGGSGTDTADGDDQITITNNGGTATIYGNAGIDQININAGTGSQTIYGGLGNDVINVTTTGNSLIVGGTSDSDTINLTQSATSNATIYGGVGITDANDLDDTITVTNGNSVVYGNAGVDTITIVDAATTMVNGGIGNDVISVGLATATSTATVFGGYDADQITITGVAGSKATVYGANSLNDSIDGADTIIGGASDDLIYGNGGNDVLSTGTGSDVLYGGVGNDTFIVNGGGQKVVADYAAASGSDTVLIQGALGGTVTATVSGNSANIASSQFGGVATAMSLSVLNQGTGTVTIGLDANANGTLEATEGRYIFGTSDASTISGSVASVTGADTLVGGDAADTFNTLSIGDSVFGNGGDDTISLTSATVAGGATAIDGGTGLDTLALNGGGTVTLSADIINVETLTVANDGAYDITTQDDNVAANATLTVNGSALTGTNTLTFDGSAEQDGKFVVTGGAGNDVITGGALADTIIGGVGADQLTGGAGSDVFRFATFGDSGATAATVDAISDLDLGSAVVAGRADTIDLPGTITFITGAGTAGVASTTAGTTEATAVSAANFDAAIAAMSNVGGDATHGQVALFDIGGVTYLIAETGANHNTFNAATDFAIQVTGVAGTLDASDIG